jgi:hypothetical protein
MLPRLSQRTYDLMRRAIDAVDRDTADLITTMVASAFIDGSKAAPEVEARDMEGRIAGRWPSDPPEHLGPKSVRQGQ